MLTERISDPNTIASKNFLAKKQSKSYPVMLLYLAQQEDLGETTAAEANDSIFSRAISECLSTLRQTTTNIDLTGVLNEEMRSLPRSSGQNYCFANSILLALAHTLPLPQQSSKSALYALLKRMTTVEPDAQLDDLVSLRSRLLSEMQANTSSMDLSGLSQEDAKDFYNLIQTTYFQGRGMFSNFVWTGVNSH